MFIVKEVYLVQSGYSLLGMLEYKMCMTFLLDISKSFTFMMPEMSP